MERERERERERENPTKKEDNMEIPDTLYTCRDEMQLMQLEQ